MINSNNIRLSFFFLLFIVCGSLPAFAQGDSGFCSETWSNGDRSSVKELRETKLPASNLLAVDGKRNGGIRVIGENRSDVLVRACVQAWAKDDAAARNLAKSIRIETNSVVRAEGANDENGWGVSYEIHVPRSTNLKLSAQNGGIGINSVEGNLEFDTHNGGIRLNDVAGNVKGRTMNGGVRVNLAGNRWQGSGLDVETTNGGVQLSMPENYAARVETGTVNGGFKSDFDALRVERDGNNRWNRTSRVASDLNGGGATVRVMTRNGGVKVESTR